MSIQSHIDPYFENRPPKEHEKTMLQLIRRDHGVDFRGRILDIGCANGNFIKLMLNELPNAAYTGIDISESLIEIARQSNDSANVSFSAIDLLGYKTNEPFDIVVASGVLSIFEDFTIPLDQCLSYLGDAGKLYIFGTFNPKNVDMIVTFRNNAVSEEWQQGMTSYSLETVGAYLRGRGLTYRFQPFEVNFDIPETTDPIRSHTVQCVDGSRLLLTGANVFYRLYHLVVYQQ